MHALAAKPALAAVCCLFVLAAQLLPTASGFAVTRPFGQSGRHVQLHALSPAKLKGLSLKKLPPLPHLPQTTEYRSPVNRATNLLTIHEVRELAKNSSMIIALNLTSMSALEETWLRESLPENATMKAVRKRLFKLAVHNTDFEDLQDYDTGQHFYIFCTEEDMVPTLRALHGFINSHPRVKRRRPIQAYSTSTQLFTSDNTTFLEKLRTKEECLANFGRIVVGVQMRLLDALKKIVDLKANATLSIQPTTEELPAGTNITAAPVNITLAGVNITVPAGVNLTEFGWWQGKTLSEVWGFAQEVLSENYTIGGVTQGAVNATDAPATNIDDPKGGERPVPVASTNASTDATTNATTAASAATQTDTSLNTSTDVPPPAAPPTSSPDVMQEAPKSGEAGGVEALTQSP
jgi:ribosomal protein L10